MKYNPESEPQELANVTWMDICPLESDLFDVIVRHDFMFLPVNSSRANVIFVTSTFSAAPFDLTSNTDPLKTFFPAEHENAPPGPKPPPPPPGGPPPPSNALPAAFGASQPITYFAK